MKKELLPKETIEKVHRCMRNTWDAISSDIFQCEGVGESIPQREVIEVVLDADYMETHGGFKKEELLEFRDLPYKDQIKIAKEVFTFKRYS
jgi:hypothetical protein